jgi:chromosome segregation ATPase
VARVADLEVKDKMIADLEHQLKEEKKRHESSEMMKADIEQETSGKELVVGEAEEEVKELGMGNTHSDLSNDSTTASATKLLEETLESIQNELASAKQAVNVEKSKTSAAEVELRRLRAELKQRDEVKACPSIHPSSSLSLSRTLVSLL